MVKRPAVFHPRGLSAPDRQRQSDQHRGSARARGYTATWEKAAKAYRREHPLCEYCALEGRTAGVDLVDHLYPHGGDADLFWAVKWWVSACTPCHSGPKQAIEHQGQAALDALALRLGRELRGQLGRGLSKV